MADQNTQPTQQDEYSTPLPEGATVGSSEQDEYSTPIPQGAVVTAQQPQTGTIKTEEPKQPSGWERMYEASGLKGMIDSAEQKELADQEVGKQVVGHVKAGNYGQAAKALLHHIGSGAVEAAAGPGITAGYGAMKNSIHEAQEAGTAAAEGKTGEAFEHAGEAVPIIGPMVGAFAKPTGEDIGSGNYQGLKGDIAGGLTQLLLAGAGDEAVEGGEAGEASQATKASKISDVTKTTVVRPTSKNIAGQEVPISTPQLSDQGLVSKGLQKFASKDAAQKFIDTKVNPAAQKAVQNNFATSAMSDIDKIRDIRGEPTGMTPKLNTLDDISTHLEKEAKKTYQKLDDAAEQDQAVWKKNKAASDAGDKNPNAGGVDYGNVSEGKTVKKDIGEKPASFTELQDKINTAERTMKSRTASVTEKGTAAENLPGYKKQMSDFLDKHKDAVEDGELDAADSMWKKSQQFKHLNKQIRGAMKGTEDVEGSSVKGSPVTVNPKALERIRQQFDNKFGTDSFENLLGKEGVKNYNDVINTLKNPIEKENFNGTLKNLFAAGVGEVAGGPLGMAGTIAGKIGATKLADNILFNPEFMKGVKGLHELWKDESGSMTNPFAPENIENENRWFQQAKQELGPNAGLSDIAQRAQKLKLAEKSGVPALPAEQTRSGGGMKVTDQSAMDTINRDMQTKGLAPKTTEAPKEPTPKAQPKSVTPNASGESSASQEAINRAKSEKQAGIKRLRITRSGQEVPLFGPDAVDAVAHRGETIVKRYADGHEEIQDQGHGANYRPKDRYKEALRSQLNATRNSLS